MHEPELNAKPIATIVIGFALLAITGEPASGQARDIEFLDIGKVLGGPIATREPLNSSAVVRETQQRYGPGDAPRSPDVSLDRPIARLALDPARLLNASVVPPGAGIALGSPLIEFAMAGISIRMAVVESKLDADFGAVHYTLVEPDSHDYARLTISRSSPEIVGTVFIEGDEYRILPETDGYQLVYPVKTYAGEFRRVDPPDLNTRAGLLEAHHLQLAWKAERQPAQFVTRTDGRLQGYVSGARGAGPPLGTIDIWRAMKIDPDGRLQTDRAVLAESISAFLEDIRHLILINDPIDVVVDSDAVARIYDGSGDRARIEIRQTVDGVPLASRLLLAVGRNGQVHGLSGPLMRLDMFDRPQSELLGRDAAIRLAVDVATEKYAIDWPLGSSVAELLYEFAGDVSSAILVWRVTIGTKCALNYRVDIRAASGEVTESVEMVTAVSVGVPEPAVLRERCRATQASVRPVSIGAESVLV